MSRPSAGMGKNLKDIRFAHDKRCRCNNRLLSETVRSHGAFAWTNQPEASSMQSRPRVVMLLNSSAGALGAQGSATLPNAVVGALKHHQILATLGSLRRSELPAAAERLRGG